MLTFILSPNHPKHSLNKTFDEILKILLKKQGILKREGLQRKKKKKKELTKYKM